MASISGDDKISPRQCCSAEVVVDFGEVPVQSIANKWIELHNFSPVSIKCTFF